MLTMDPLAYVDMAHRPGISNRESTMVYNEWAKDGKYDQAMRDCYRGPVVAAEAVAKFFPENREEKLILDFASGTGFVGIELQRLGFRKVHGLDPSQGMLEEAEKKKIYEKQFCCYLDHNKLPIDDDTYDCAMCSGGFGHGRIPAVGLRELARIVKPGGLVCFAMREEYIQDVAEYRDRLENLMKEMETSGAWKLHSRTIVPRYSFDKNTGICFQFIVS